MIRDQTPWLPLRRRGTLAAALQSPSAAPAGGRDYDDVRFGVGLKAISAVVINR